MVGLLGGILGAILRHVSQTCLLGTTLASTEKLVTDFAINAKICYRAMGGKDMYNSVLGGGRISIIT